LTNVKLIRKHTFLYITRGHARDSERGGKQPAGRSLRLAPLTAAIGYANGSD